MFDDLPDDWESKHRMSPEEYEETTNYLKNHPLFMKEIPQNIEDYPDLLALQNLLHDDSPENLARSFKEKGNEHFKKGAGKKYFIRQAIQSYTEGIEANSSEKNVNAQLYNNRALMHMHLKNFGRAIDDCKSALKQDEKFIKAYFRKAQVESTLRRYEDSLITCLTALQIEPENKEVLALRTDIERQIEIENSKKRTITQHKKTQSLELLAECKKRRIYLGKKILDCPDSCKQSIYLDEKKNLHFPIFVHYPEFSQMDYIDDTREKDSLLEHLQVVFKENLPWDHQKYYSLENINVYIEFNQVKSLSQISDITTWPAQQGFKIIDPTLTIAQIFSARGYVLPMVPEITIVSRVSPFYSVFQEQYDFV